MIEQTKTDASCPDYGRDAGAQYPLRNWWQPSWLFNQDLGLTLFSLAPGDLRWVDWLQRRSAASSWPGYTHSPLVVPHVPGTMHHPSPRMSQAEAAGLPEIGNEQYRWRFYLDVFHFSPSEITLSVSNGFLEIGGKHEERRDEHGFIARCFTRKYRLPIGVDVTKITSTLSGDGVLCVEAPCLASSLPAGIIIPVQVEKETTDDNEREDRDDQQAAPEAPETPESSATEPTTEASDHGEESESSPTEYTTEASDHGEESSATEPIKEASDQGEESSATEPITEASDHGDESSATEPITEASDQGEESPLEAAGEEAQPGSTTAGLEQHEESVEQEEEGHGEPAEEPHPAEESLPEPDTAVADQTEDAALDGEPQPPEEIAQPEEQEPSKSPPPADLSQELEAPDTKF